MYGSRNTFWRRDVEVSHALAHEGPRYDISYGDKANLREQIERGRRTIGEWLRRNRPNLTSFDAQIDARADAVVLPPD